MGEVVGFWRSRIILTAAELDLFTRLDESPSTAAGLASRTGCDQRALERLLNGLTALGLLEKEGGLFRPSPQGRILSSGHPESVLAAVLHFNDLWRKWSRLTEVVRTGKPVERVGGEEGEAHRRDFIAAMHVIGRDLSMEVARAYDAGRFRRLLDIGGASGTYTIAFLRENPQMKAVLFDLAPVIPMARERIETEGLADRVTLVAGDFSRDELPPGCDLALLSAVIHQNSPAQNLDLFRKVYRALNKGGSILIRDDIMDESGTKPAAGALFALNMLLNTRGGGSYALGEVREALEKAGFTRVEQVRAGERMDSLVEARKIE
jgi:SAM-dependent methyltransferase